MVHFPEEALFINLIALFRQDFLGEVNGEAVGVMELEGLCTLKNSASCNNHVSNVFIDDAHSQFDC